MIEKEEKQLKEPSEKQRLAQYTDVVGGVSSRALKLAKLYVRHKLLLQRVGIGALVAWCVVTVGYSLFAWGEYLIFGYSEDQQMYAQQAVEFINYEALKPLYQAAEIQTDNRIEVYRSAEDRYDFATRAINFNERWVAIIDYKFVYGGGETEAARTIMLPGERRPIIYFGHEASSYPVGAKLVLENVTWRKISAHDVPDIMRFIEERKNFHFDNFKFTGQSRLTALDSHMIEFDLYNVSPYNYWQPKFYIELMQGARPVGFMFLVAEKFKAGEKRKIDLRSVADDLSVSDIRIYPVVNVFDGDEYMPVQ